MLSSSRREMEQMFEAAVGARAAPPLPEMENIGGSLGEVARRCGAAGLGSDEEDGVRLPAWLISLPEGNRCAFS